MLRLPLAFARSRASSFCRIVTVLALVLAGSGCSLATQSGASPDTDPIVVFVVRHSERAEDGTSDPVVSLPGWDRSRLLATMLADAGLTHIHTTDFRRTRGTGRPVVAALGLDMTVYDARDLPGFAEQLRQTPGRHLVIGHSNTTPALVAALGGDPISPIEEMEYDRLYIVTLTRDGASSVLVRFGQPYGG